MPAHQHAQPPRDDGPPPSRRDHRSPAASDPLEHLYRQMLAETMRPCRELPLDERLAKRAADRRMQRAMEDAVVERAAHLRAS